MTLTIGRGRGYVPADLNRGPETTIGVVPIDDLLARPACLVRGRRRARRQAAPTTSSSSRSPPTARSSRRRRSPAAEPSSSSCDLRRSGADRGARRHRRSRRGGGAHDVPRHGELPDRGARARGAPVQLPEARRDRDDRRPDLQVRRTSCGDPELRSQVDRGGPRPRRARPHAQGRGPSGSHAARTRRQEARPRLRRTARRCTRTWPGR